MTCCCCVLRKLVTRNDWFLKGYYANIRCVFQTPFNLTGTELWIARNNLVCIIKFYITLNVSFFYINTFRKYIKSPTLFSFPLRVIPHILSSCIFIFTIYKKNLKIKNKEQFVDSNGTQIHAIQTDLHILRHLYIFPVSIKHRLYTH